LSKGASRISALRQAQGYGMRMGIVSIASSGGGDDERIGWKKIRAETQRSQRERKRGFTRRRGGAEKKEGRQSRPIIQQRASLTGPVDRSSTAATTPRLRVSA
ncbi:MAG TPA: hypothetical protein PKC77_11480, partial [Sphingopyxis sp.]|nr:hypothetical protein [Sphingopyxis sp.]